MHLYPGSTNVLYERERERERGKKEGREEGRERVEARGGWGGKGNTKTITFASLIQVPILGTWIREAKVIVFVHKRSVFA